jgi:hypothetical protein
MSEQQVSAASLQLVEAFESFEPEARANGLRDVIVLAAGAGLVDPGRKPDRSGDSEGQESPWKKLLDAFVRAVEETVIPPQLERASVTREMWSEAKLKVLRGIADLFARVHPSGTRFQEGSFAAILLAMVFDLWDRGHEEVSGAAFAVLVSNPFAVLFSGMLAEKKPHLQEHLLLRDLATKDLWRSEAAKGLLNAVARSWDLRHPFMFAWRLVQPAYRAFSSNGSRVPNFEDYLDKLGADLREAGASYSHLLGLLQQVHSIDGINYEGPDSVTIHMIRFPSIWDSFPGFREVAMSSIREWCVEKLWQSCPRVNIKVVFYKEGEKGPYEQHEILAPA